MVGADNTRSKSGQPLFFLLSAKNTPNYTKTAEFLQKQWAKIGAKVQVSYFSQDDLQTSVVGNHDYDALLYGISIGVDPERINGYASTELTHTAIAAFVASGMADAGLGVAPAAHHFGLDFLPIVDEDYYFACDRARLQAQPLASALAVLRSDDFRANVAVLEGYDPTHCGEIVEVVVGLHGAPQSDAPQAGR